jgi:hypothetical protein
MKTITIQVLISALILSVSAYSNADTYATTDAGKRVELNANGTWQYLKERGEHVDDLSYADDLVKVAFKKARIYKPKHSKSFKTEIQLSVTVATRTQIINPRTVRDAIGFGCTLKDSFGNDMKVYAVSPEYTGYNEQGLRPGQTQIFKILAKDYPLETATHLVLKIEKRVFGSNRSITLKISTDKIDKI